MEIRGLYDRLISTMGFLILVRRHLNIGTQFVLTTTCCATNDNIGGVMMTQFISWHHDDSQFIVSSLEAL